MFLLFGTRRQSKVLAQTERKCTKCARPTMHTAIETQRKFTFFFIPLIPMGSSHTIRCNVCGLVQNGAALQAKPQAAAKPSPATT